MDKKLEVIQTRQLYVLLLILAFSFLLLFSFMGRLGHDFMNGDVGGYWQDSLSWRTPFHPFHVPGYPLLIALFRNFSFELLSPVTVMSLINLIAFISCALMVYKIIRFVGGAHELGISSAFLFGLWPLVGLTYTVVPLADMVAMCFFLAGFLLLLRSRREYAAIMLGMSLITHKAMWIVVGLTLVADFLLQNKKFSKNNFLFWGILAFPIVLLWVLGSIYHESISWLFSSNLQVELSSKGAFPIFDGLIGTMVEGGLTGLAKGSILLSFFVVNLAVLILSVKNKTDHYVYGLFLSIGSMMLFIFLNQHEIWAAIRFSRLLILPLAFIIRRKQIDIAAYWMSFRVLLIIFVLFLYASQFAYAWYIVKVFYA